MSRSRRSRVVCLLLFAIIALGIDARSGYAQRGGAIGPFADKIDVTRDVEYAKAGDVSLKLDIYQPKQRSEETLPALVFIHGGGWRNGDKERGAVRIAPFVASGNYVGFSIQYRLTGIAGWPAQIHDCKAAIRWIKAHAAEYKIDPARIGVWGTSAGGHLVSMLGTSGGVAELEGELGVRDADSRVKCVVNFCGPTDFLAFKLTERAGGPVQALLGGRIAERQEMARSASPVTYVTADDPAFLHCHGTADAVVPVDQAQRLHDKLKAAGVNSTLVLIEGGGHGIGGPEVIERVRRFLARELRGADVEVSSEPIVLKK